jgi:phosphoserine/homoserine phosphotransferase
MKIVCFDLEGVLIPEFWEELNKATGIEEFKLTTRDISDYDELMGIRIKALKENNIDFDKMKSIVSTMNPLDGAIEFLDWVRERAQVVILTGSFYDYIMPLLKKLKYPTTFANFCEIENNMLVGYKMREDNGKINMINRFHEAGLSTIAVGDSFNDLKMLKGAGAGIMFKPNEKMKEAGGNLPVANNYEELKKELLEVL